MGNGNGKSAATKGRGLTKLQAAFVQEYLVDLNGKEAAIRCGSTTKYPDRWAWQILQLPHVAQEIAKAIEQRKKRTQVTQDRVIEELARIAFLDIRDFYDEQGNLRAISDLPTHAAAALRGMDVSFEAGGEDRPPTQVRKIRMADKVKALELLARHMGMLDDRLKLNVGGDLALRMDRIAERGRKRSS